MLEDLKEQYLEVEGWIEEKIGDVFGDFQGGNVDIMTSEQVDKWRDRLRFDIKEYLT